MNFSISMGLKFGKLKRRKGFCIADCQENVEIEEKIAKKPVVRIMKNCL